MSFTPHWLIFMGPCSGNSQCYYYLKCEMDLPVACAKFYWEVRCHPNGNTLQWRHDGSDGFLNPQSHDCLLNRLFRRRSKKTPKLSLAFVRGIHRSPVNSPHKWPVTPKMFPFDDVIMTHVAPMCESYHRKPRSARQTVGNGTICDPVPACVHWLSGVGILLVPIIGTPFQQLSKPIK